MYWDLSDWEIPWGEGGVVPERLSCEFQFESHAWQSCELFMSEIIHVPKDIEFMELKWSWTENTGSNRILVVKHLIPQFQIKDLPSLSFDYSDNDGNLLTIRGDVSEDSLLILLSESKEHAFVNIVKNSWNLDNTTMSCSSENYWVMGIDTTGSIDFDIGNNDLAFKNWCNTNIQIAEAYEILSCLTGRDSENELINQDLVWIHVSSVGEFEQAKPIIDSIKKKHNYKILISYFSSSTEGPVSEYKNVDYHFYIVSDKTKSMQNLFNLLKPRVLILIKYEFWHNLIKLAKLNSIPIISISSVFRKNQIYFYPGSFFKNILRNISLFLVQNEESLNLLKKIKIKNVKVIGDTRYDRVLEIFNSSKEINSIKEFINNKNTIIIGSSWKSDIEIIKNEIIRDLTDTKYIIVPHNINSRQLDNL